MDVNSGQAGRSSSLWLLSYRRLADFVVSIVRSNDAAGPISAAVSLHNLLQVPRVGGNVMAYPLEEGNWPS